MTQDSLDKLWEKVDHKLKLSRYIVWFHNSTLDFLSRQLSPKTNRAKCSMRIRRSEPKWRKKGGEKICQNLLDSVIFLVEFVQNLVTLLRRHSVDAVKILEHELKSCLVDLSKDLFGKGDEITRGLNPTHVDIFNTQLNHVVEIN